MNIQEEKLNPKCNACKTYWKPDETDIKPSGACAKTCKKCRNRQKEIRLKKKCEHGKEKRHCRECDGSSYCEHNVRKGRCKECGGSSLCEHKVEKSSCVKCGGSSICEHNRERRRCRECEGNGFCEHNVRKNRCKKCCGGSICEHNRERYTCKECHGGGICEHQHERRSCKECGGNALCEHKRIRSICKECNGGSICEHQRIRSYCKECNGGGICEHQRIRGVCKECKGGQICEHNRQKRGCKDCNFQLYLIGLQRKGISRLFIQSDIPKTKRSIEYLGMDSDEFILFFEKKMNLYNAKNEIKMTWMNIHIDHIKPISVFDLDDEDEFLSCCNFTNLQPLLGKDNLEKHNKWDITSELYWNTHIKDNDNFFDIYNVK